jgi:hypothetical protein
MTNVMVQVNGKWKIETSSAFGSDVDFTKLANYLKATSEAIEETTAEVQIKKLPLNQIGIALFEKTSTKRGLRN